MKKSNLKKLAKLEDTLEQCIDDFIEILDDEDDLDGNLDCACDRLCDVKYVISRYFRKLTQE